MAVNVNRLNLLNTEMNYLSAKFNSKGLSELLNIKSRIEFCLYMFKDS